MKAIILSAGEGTRMRPLTLTKPKTMLPVAGKPIIQYNIEALRDCGVKDILLIVGYKDRQNSRMPLMGVNGIVDILVALLIFLFPHFVAGLVVYLIGFALLIFGIFQLIALSSANKVMKVGFMAFVMPVLVLMAGALLLARPAILGTAVGMVAGAALIVYGVSELLSSWKMKKAMDEYDTKIKDVDYEKVDEQ